MSSLTLILLGVGAFASLAFALVGASTSKAAERLERIRNIPDDDEFAGADQAAQRETSEASGVLESEGGLLSQLGEYVARLAGSGARSGNEGVYAETRQRLREAGYRRPSALAIYQGSRWALGLAVPLAGTVGAFSFTGASPHMVVILVMAFVGFLIPGVTVDQQRKRRLEGISRGLPDAIDLMVICVESGLSLRATMARVAKELEESQPIIAGEFRATVLECEAGRGLMDAIREMAKRTGDPNLAALVALLVQTDRFGTPMIDTLRTQADAMRYERMQTAEELANKAPVKMLFPSLMIFGAVLLIIAGPAFMTIFANLPG